VGPDTCQITFFGMEETNDWFYRRKGAFQDALIATERLLAAGIKPRWQIFLTRKLLPEIDEMMCLIERLKLRKRVQELGSEFQLFMHTPGPEYEGRKIEYLRPTLEEVSSLPSELIESSKRHFNKDFLWKPEGGLYASIMEGQGITARDEMALDEPDIFWFFITNEWSVYSNVGTLEPWWRLGNLKTDKVETIMRRFEQDEILGLETLCHYPIPKLAQQFGDPEGTKIYSGISDLLSLYRARHCEEMWQE
jgi:MoaA/NifB/PqqE/SkfB family radical SAM enzyme